jgi:hypothetical protein
LAPSSGQAQASLAVAVCAKPQFLQKVENRQGLFTLKMLINRQRKR